MNRKLASRLNTLAGCILLGLVVVSAQSWYALRTNESLRAGLLSVAVGLAVTVFFRRSAPSQRAAKVVSDIRVVREGRVQPSRREKAGTRDELYGQTVRLRSLIRVPSAAPRRAAA